ncbi:MAG: NAD-dependent epimerase/dehydratase family protein [Planctomycetes bacterium]|nr:NAD-dependent epimerase/dehydratase family protein [Planctomycetota bacterium]
MTKVLVTGAGGFIGSHVVEQLLTRGDAVRCLVRARSPRPWLEGCDVEFSEGDITQPETLPSAVAGCDVVIHLAGRTAALSYDQFLEVNAHGVRNVAQACAKQPTPPTLVVVSSLAAAGPAENGQARVESELPRPVSQYGRSKLAGEREAAALAAEAPISIVRPPIVLGPRDRMAFALFRPIRRFRVHLIPGFRTRRFSLIHAADLADALIRVADQGRRLPAADGNGASGDGIYYAADAEQPTFSELGRLLACALGRPHALRVHVPELLAWTVGGASELAAQVLRRPAPLSLDKVREAVAGDWTCNASRIRHELGFQPAAVLEERIRQTAQWYREAGWL